MADEKTQDAVSTRVREDLRALRAASERDLPSFAETERALRRAVAQRERLSTDHLTIGESIMQTIARSPYRRALSAAAAAAVCAGVLLWPLSYQRTVGHSVRVTLPGVRPEGARPLARQIRAALGAEALSLNLDPGGLTVTARVPSRSRSQVQHQADALVQALGDRRVVASAQVTARTEQVAGRVYAMALDKVIEIRVDMQGKTAAQIRDEIRAQLQAGGMTDAVVDVQRAGDETKVDIAGSMDGEARQVQVVRRGDAGGPLELKLGDIDTRREPGMTDDQLREKIERQLRQKGLTPTVTVQGDQIQIRGERHLETQP